MVGDRTRRHGGRGQAPTLRQLGSALRGDASEQNTMTLSAIAEALSGGPVAVAGRPGVVVTFGWFAFDMDTCELKRTGETQEMSLPERRILQRLILDHLRYVPPEELVPIAWPSGNGHAANVRTAIAALRRRLGRGIVQTRRGVGYRFIGKFDVARKRSRPRAKTGEGRRADGQTLSG